MWGQEVGCPGLQQLFIVHNAWGSPIHPEGILSKLALNYLGGQARKAKKLPEYMLHLGSKRQGTGQQIRPPEAI